MFRRNSSTSRRYGSRAGRVLALLLPAVLMGCQSPGALAPHSPLQPWTPEELPPTVPLKLSSVAEPEGAPVRLSASTSFAVPTVAEAGVLALGPEVQQDQAYSLPELIDLAQRHSPLTRAAWEQARQAASAVGMAEALFLPMISAIAVGGTQRFRQPLPLAIGELDEIQTTISGVVPALTLEWLLFDFGERAAGLEAARQLSFGANVQFQGAHQRLIQAVALAYYQYDAARIRTGVATEALQNAESVLAAVQAKRRQGVATVLEEAQARQQVAQAKLLEVQARGAERDSYQALIAATGLPPDAKLTIAPSPERALPAQLHDEVEEQLRSMLARRPDVLAAYAAAQAAQHGVTAAEAAFGPKVFLTGSVAHISDRLNINGLSFVGQPINTAGFLVGVSLPIFDGGLRQQRLGGARARADEAVALWRQVQENAVLEMVMASNALRTALQAHEAAQEWVRTATTNYDAAFDAYQHGVSTVTLATEAMMGLLAARMAAVDAQAAARAAAVNLAHASGLLTSADQAVNPVMAQP